MRCYEEELKRPIRNLVNGELARSLLIQAGGPGRVMVGGVFGELVRSLLVLAEAHRHLVIV
jgi:hypothetical protein